MFKAIYTSRDDGDWDLYIIVNLEHEYGEDMLTMFIYGFNHDNIEYKAIDLDDNEVCAASIISRAFDHN